VGDAVDADGPTQQAEAAGEGKDAMTRRPDDTADIVRRLAALDITRTPLYRHVTTAALFLEAHGVEPAVAEAVARRVPLSLIGPLIKQLARDGSRCEKRIR